MRTSPFVVAALLCRSLVPATADVIWSEDFESLAIGATSGNNQTIGNIQTANQLGSEIVAAPVEFTLASGNVAALSTLLGNNFSAIRPSTNPINLPAIADGLSWSLSFDIYIPADLVEEVGGMASLRWKDGAANNVNGPSDNTFQTLTAGEHHIEYSGTFPIDIGNGPFLPTNVRPFINFDQAGTGDVSNFVYFDNLLFEVGVSEDDPNLDAGAVGFGQLAQSEGPYTRPLVIANSGTANNLTITAATVTGPDAAKFMVANATFPLVVDADDIESIDIVFDPGDDIGDFAASLELASDDESDAVIALALTGSTTAPFVGKELIINGDFETGDLTGWREDALRYAYTDAQTRSGMGAAVYTTVAMQEFGNTRIAAEPPLGVDGDPATLVITPDMIGKNYEYSAWYYRPSTAGMEDDDEVITIFRWNKINQMARTHGSALMSAIPFDTWIRVVGTGTIPETDTEGNPTTSVEIVWSYRDHGANNPGGLMTFIDDVSFKVDVPPAPPTFEDPVITDLEIDEANDVIRITWTSVPDATYALDRGTDLTPLALLEQDDSILTPGSTHTFEDVGAVTLGAPNLFYRVRLVELP